MKKIITLIGFLLCTSLLLATTYHTVSLTGDPDNDFASDEYLGQFDGIKYYVTWDSLYVYFAWKYGTSNFCTKATSTISPSDGAVFVINTDPSGTAGITDEPQEDGSSGDGLGYDFTLAIDSHKPDYCFWWEDVYFFGSSMPKNILYDIVSGNWHKVASKWDPAAFSKTSHATQGAVEVKIAWSDFGGKPSSFRIMMWVNEKGGNNNPKSVMPSGNSTGNRPINMEYDRTYSSTSSGVAPNSAGTDDTLPVELSAFIVQLLNNTPTLYWITQTETNNLGFNVYRGEYEDAYKDDKVIKVNGSIIAGQGTTSQAHDYLYKDYNEIENGKQYWYWLESVNYDGTTDLYDPIIFVMQEKKTSNRGPKIPQKYGLYQNAPNPFSCKGGSVYSGNTKTMIKFKLRNEGQSVVPVTLDIYNIKGQLIKTLIDNEYKEVNKIYSVFWEPESINSGIYFYRLKTPYSVEVKKMIVLK